MTRAAEEAAHSAAGGKAESTPYEAVARVGEAIGAVVINPPARCLEQPCPPVTAEIVQFSD